MSSFSFHLLVAEEEVGGGGGGWIGSGRSCQKGGREAHNRLDVEGRKKKRKKVTQINQGELRDDQDFTLLDCYCSALRGK